MDTGIQFYSDESLESFLLRLSQEQGYERYSHFAEDILYDAINPYEPSSGAFPLELDQVNIYHSQTTSQMRVRVLIHLENQLRFRNYGVLCLALSHSKSKFSPDYKAVHRCGSDYPYSFVRKRYTPICPKCIEKAPYIRLQWQLIPHQVCEQHECKLIHQCPDCDARLEYQNSEDIVQCTCGFDLRNSPVEVAPSAKLLVARWLSCNESQSIGRLPLKMMKSERYGFLLWYVNRYGSTENICYESFVEYCACWPKILWQELDELVDKAELMRIKVWKRMFFNEVFGKLLKECRQLPSRQLERNIVLVQIFAHFKNLMSILSSSTRGNVGDVLLSPLEASTLLSCTTDEVYRLYDIGEVKAAIRPKLHTKIASHVSAFTLRSIIEIKLTCMCSENDGLNVYLPEW